ncbi:hypothetical protein EES39_24905 [Streptomyces sp. ADI92-24]|nr:hypothetical protein EDD95_3681 [Streptomyces sp. CEV 2-1]RPK40419.1 hypothetical protein EES39_24905 [Streptomyces sp. ADI92-24]
MTSWSASVRRSSPCDDRHCLPTSNVRSLRTGGALVLFYAAFSRRAEPLTPRMKPRAAPVLGATQGFYRSKAAPVRSPFNPALGSWDGAALPAAEAGPCAHARSG